MRQFKNLLDLEGGSYKLAFGDIWLERQLDFLWKDLLKEFKLEWTDLSVTLEYEDEQEDFEILIYDVAYDDRVIKYSKKGFIYDDLESISLDSTAEDDDFKYELATSIPDNFDFDDFFFDNFYLFMLISFFFFPFFFFELTVFVFYIAFISKYLPLGDIEDEEPDPEELEPLPFLEEELDIAHYDYAQFHFEPFMEMDKMIFHSGFWKNKSYFKVYNLLKFKK